MLLWLLRSSPLMTLQSSGRWTWPCLAAGQIRTAVLELRLRARRWSGHVHVPSQATTPFR